ncbi:metacaspase-9 [Phtheirospermum japonicum]|uniref:Metacaspase-9 n=1 Tax=Phtheirospermum japonicum TaxID=374723 RepID=A0A830D1Q4_9LAMI|nr:metacaspase-9 [Phtheirospermum japonicum]
MREVLITRFGFDPKHVELLTDKPGSSIMPTGANIKSALNRMVDRAEEGAVLFFHYSGHGTLINHGTLFKSHNSSEEAIVPCDFNLITSVDFRHIVNRVPKGVTFTILSDSCHSGGLIDKEKEQIGPRTTPDKAVSAPARSYKPKVIPFQSILQHFTSLTSKINTDIGTHLVEVFGQDASLMFRSSEPINKPLRADEGILLSGCQTDEYSADVDTAEDGEKAACGAFSNAVQMVLKENPGQALSNRDIVVMARKTLSLQHFEKQHPCLYCSDENADAVFLGTHSSKNSLNG